MCGIAGYVDLASSPSDTEILDRMAVSLRHRGPDDSGVLIDGPCGLSHTRLAIIDLSHSHQPMQVSGSPLSLVYNGELYNYRQLRKELQEGGVRFETDGDTEVVLRCIERDWITSFPCFDGMFGLAAWHRHRRKLLLARDPLGIKPLFYTLPRSTLIVFGSEIKALLEHPEVACDLDEDALRQVLRFRAVYGENSLYCGIRQLPPGCFLEFDERGLKVGRHFDLNDETERQQESLKGINESCLIRRGEELFTSAVRKRLVADVPVGAFLSGGLDSSLIVAAIRASIGLEKDFCTFSVGFRNDDSSELPYARLAAKTTGSRHTEILVSEADYLADFVRMTNCRDAPLSEPQDLAIAKMSRVARQHVKVVLSGEGADEAFAGYPKYRFAAPPRVLSWALRTMGPKRAAALAQTLGLDPRRSLIAAEALSSSNETAQFAQWFASLDRTSWSQLLPGLEWSSDQWANTQCPQSTILSRMSSLSALRRMQTVDCLTWLPNNLLERGDRMTMSTALEMRVPFLDKALVPFGLALQKPMKLRGRHGKWIVRQWAKRRIPRDISQRPKCGFRIPLAQWFRGELRDILFSYLTANRGLCGVYGDTARIANLLNSHDRQKTDAHLVLWGLLAAEVWYQDVFLSRRTLRAYDCCR